MEHTAELVPRILRDIDDSVLALDARGHITYMNEQCRALLGVGSGGLSVVWFVIKKKKFADLVKIFKK